MIFKALSLLIVCDCTMLCGMHVYLQMYWFIYCIPIYYVFIVFVLCELYACMGLSKGHNIVHLYGATTNIYFCMVMVFLTLHFKWKWIAN